MKTLTATYMLWASLLATNAQMIINPYQFTSGGSFSPSDISGLVGWWRGSDDWNSGDVVTNWADLSGNNYSLTNVAASSPYATNRINSQPGLWFDGTSDHLFQPLLGPVFDGSDTPITMVVVFQAENASPPISAAIVSLTSTTDTAPVMEVSIVAPSSYRLFRRDDFNGTKLIASSGADTSVHSLIGVFTGSVGTLYLDGDVIGTEDTDMNVGVLTTTVGCVGALKRSSLDYYFKGTISEVLLYDSAIGTTDRGNLQAYLDARYGL